MSKTWVDFYKSFLSAPIRFPDETEARVRKRGTPISYTLSVVCSETILFMMDFAVNQRLTGYTSTACMTTCGSGIRTPRR